MPSEFEKYQQEMIDKVAKAMAIPPEVFGTEVLKCSNCGAVCKEKKTWKRFLRRHPALCQARKAFAKQLASGTKSVDADVEAGPQGYGKDWPCFRS